MLIEMSQKGLSQLVKNINTLQLGSGTFFECCLKIKDNYYPYKVY